MLGVVSALMITVAAKHLPTHHAIDGRDDELTLNEQLFNDINTLIKRQLIANVAVNLSRVFFMFGKIIRNSLISVEKFPYGRRT